MTNKLFRVVTSLALALSVAACANTSQEAYYKAVERSAIAQQQAHEAKMQALSSLAQSADPAAKGAAVMAMALTQAPVIAPQYVQSEGLQWAQVLATPVAAVAGFAINASVAKNASDNATAVQMANFSSQERIQLGQQDMLIGALGASGAGATAAVNGLVDLGTAGFAALNQAGGQTVDVATSGLGVAQQVATTGFQTTGDIATLGYGVVENVSNTGMSGLVSLGESGLTTAESLGLAGINAAVTQNQDNNALVESVTQGYNQVLTTVTTQGIQVENTQVCSVDALGAVTCN